MTKRLARPGGSPPLDFAIAVLITGAMMLTYVIFGGMLATT